MVPMLFQPGEVFSPRFWCGVEREKLSLCLLQKSPVGFPASSLAEHLDPASSLAILWLLETLRCFQSLGKSAESG